MRSRSELSWNWIGQWRFDIRLRDLAKDGSPYLGSPEVENAIDHSVLIRPVFHFSLPTQRPSIKAGSQRESHRGHLQSSNRSISVFH